jgi:phosphoketolase
MAIQQIPRPDHGRSVLPILHLNGFKISNPTILVRVEHEELEQFFRGCGWDPLSSRAASRK